MSFTSKELHFNLFQFLFISQHGWCRFVFWNSEPCSCRFCLQWSCSKVRNLLIYPLVSKLDWWLIFPYCILALSKRQLTKVKENDLLGIVLCSGPATKLMSDHRKIIWKLCHSPSSRNVPKSHSYQNYYMNTVHVYLTLGAYLWSQ